MSTTTYQTIIDAIDAAITAWVGDPVSMTFAGGTVTYRSLTELIEARRHYASLLRTSGGGVAFQLHRIKAGA